MNQFIHPDFKLNGKSFSYIELLSEALYLKENRQLFEKNKEVETPGIAKRN